MSQPQSEASGGSITSLKLLLYRFTIAGTYACLCSALTALSSGILTPQCQRLSTPRARRSPEWRS